LFFIAELSHRGAGLGKTSCGDGGVAIVSAAPVAVPMSMLVATSVALLVVALVAFPVAMVASWPT